MTGARNVVVVGGGIVGLAAALAFGARGDNVTVLERDNTPTPATPEEAWTSWKRRGAPQLRQPHALLARMTLIIRRKYPEVYDRLIAAGATELPFSAHLDPGLVEYVPVSDDDELIALSCRRTTFELVLRNSAAAHALVSFRPGHQAAGLVGAPCAAGSAPHVTGVRLAGGEVFPADITIVADGRRSALPGWCAELGAATMPEAVEDTGFLYVSRFYRLRHGRKLPRTKSSDRRFRTLYLNGGITTADDGTLSVQFSVPIGDIELRRALCTNAGFDRAVDLLAVREQLPAEFWEPISEVTTMSGMINRWRDIVVDGAPVVTGAFPVGDSVICTNPAYGRGMSTGFWSVDLLLQVLEQHPDDRVAQVMAYDAALRRKLHPWYLASVKQDRVNRREADIALGRDPPQVQSGSKFNPAQLLPLLETDVPLNRAFTRMLNLLDPPDSVTRPETLALILTARARMKLRPASRGAPSRDELIEWLTTGSRGFAYASSAQSG